MAIVKLTNNQTLTISREKSHELWKILNGEKEGTEEQQKFCANVKKIYLNRHFAPDTYLQAHKAILSKMI